MLIQFHLHIICIHSTVCFDNAIWCELDAWKLHVNEVPWMAHCAV